MQEFDTTNEQERFFVEKIKELRLVNHKLSKLLLQKEELTDEIIDVLDHSHEGQKTYEYGELKIEVKTPINYSLDKSLYETGSLFLPKKFNPIKKSVSYSVDKRLYEEYLNSAPKDARESLIALITKKPGNKSVTIKERV
jgi:hypothetical protein